MAFIGHIIKGAIYLKDFVSKEVNHVEAQKNVLKDLLTKAKDTQFGKHYDFKTILESDEVETVFAKQIPYFDYNKINEAWWHKLHEGESDVTWPGNPNYFALSSGTTGKTSKRIPVTDEMIEAIRQAGIKQVFALKNFDLPADFFEKDIMMLGSSTDLQENNDHLEGEISGISHRFFIGIFNFRT